MRASLWRFAAASVLTISVLASVGCGQRSVGVVNGEKITQDEFYKRLARFPIAPQVQFPPPIEQQAAVTVLNQIISEKLLLDLAEKEKVTPTQEQLDERKEQLNKALGDRQNSLTDLLNKSGMSHKELDDRLRPEIAQMNLLAKFVKVSDDEVKAAYESATTKLPEENKIRSAFFLPASAKVYAILNKDKAKIDKAYQQLNNGVSFGVVAQEYSEDDVTRKRRGLVGWIEKPDAVRPPLQGVPPMIYDKAFSTGKGKNTPPFKAGNEWIILRIEDARPAKMQSYDHVKGVIRDRLLQTKAASSPDGKKIADMMEKARKEAKVEVTLPDYKEIFKDFAEKIKETPAATTTTTGTGTAPAAPAPGGGGQ